MLSQLNQKKGFRLLVALIVAFGLLAGAADGAEKKK
jgi:hypothetical protein